jgi:hypothetical protein
LIVFDIVLQDSESAGQEEDSEVVGKEDSEGVRRGEDEDSYGVGHEHHEDFFNGVWREENFYGLGQEDPDTASLGGATWSPLL